MQSSEEQKKAKKRAADKKKDDRGHAREYNQLLKEISEQRVRDMKQARGWKTLDSDDTLPNVCREGQAPSPSEEDDPET